MSLWIPKPPYDFNEPLIQVFAELGLTPLLGHKSLDIVYYKLVEWDMYKSKILDKTNEARIQSTKVTKIVTAFRPSISCLSHNHIKQFDICESVREKTCISVSFDGIFGLMTTYKYTTSFVNMLSFVCVFDMNGVRKSFDH